MKKILKQMLLKNALLKSLIVNLKSHVGYMKDGKYEKIRKKRNDIINYYWLNCLNNIISILFFIKESVKYIFAYYMRY